MIKSIRTKIALWFSTVLLLILMVFSSLTYFILRKSLISSVDSKLENLAESISSRLFEPEAVFLQFVDKSGSLKPRKEEIKYAVIPISLRSLRRANKGLITFETIKDLGGSHLRVITYPVKTPEDEYSIIQIATPIDRLLETLRLFLIIVLLTIPVAAIISTLGGIFITNKVLSPIKEITMAARRISSENLSERLEIRSSDELGELARTFNDMIERLERSFLRMKEFSADVSHELKTPLTALKGEIEVALLRDRSKEEYKRILRSALEEIDRLTRVVNDLLTLSKGEMGKLLIEKERVKVEDVVVDVVSQIYGMMEEKNIEFSMDKKGEDVVLGDRNLLKQLFLNLIENAVKYNVEGGRIKVCIDGSRDGWVSVKVEDTGVGIPKEEIPKIFEKFYRVDKSRSRKVGGAGLGLSIAKWIVEAHGGRIKVESDLGKGATFVVFLPRA